MTLWLRNTSSDSAIWIGVNNPPPSEEWVASNNFGMTVSEAAVAPVFDDPGYDNLANYNVGDIISISPQLSTPGNPDPTFSIASGSLPTGTSINSDTGVISGELTQPETPLFTVEALNSEGSSTTQVSFTVNAVGDYGFELIDCREPESNAVINDTGTYQIQSVSDNSFISSGVCNFVNGNVEIIDSNVTTSGVNYRLQLVTDSNTYSLVIPSIESVEITP